MKKFTKILVLFGLMTLIILPMLNINAIPSNDEGDWVTITMTNPSFEKPTVEGWVTWESGYSGEGFDSCCWFFVTYEIYVRYVHATGYKNSGLQRFEIEIVTFQVKRNNRLWSGGYKTMNSLVGLKDSSGEYAKYDEVLGWPYPETSYSTYSRSWYEFFDYSDNILEVKIGLHWNMIPKAVAISTLPLYF